jgi:hypothetical protein
MREISKAESVLCEHLRVVLDRLPAQAAIDDTEDFLKICCLMSQELTPLHVRLQLSVSGDWVSWIECRLGEKVDGVLLKVPYRRGIANGLTVMKRLDSIEWFYGVGYGERREPATEVDSGGFMK